MSESESYIEVESDGTNGLNWTAKLTRSASQILHFEEKWTVLSPPELFTLDMTQSLLTYRLHCQLGFEGS